MSTPPSLPAPLAPPLGGALAWADQWIPVGAGEPLKARVYGSRPRGRSAPLVLHFHGGAFVAGGLDSGATVAGLLAEAGAVVVSLDYPLAPAHPFPAAIEAGHAALTWMHRHRSRLAGQSATVWVAGEEAGGNLAAAVALMARDRRSPPLAGQILMSPMLDPCVATASLRDADAGPVGCLWADGWHQYLPGAADADHPYAAPASAMRLTGVPRTLLITAQDDPLRDEARAYARRLRDAGVEVDEAFLDQPTGWPCACKQPAGAQAAWAPVVRGQFQAFLQRAHAPAAVPVSASSSIQNRRPGSLS
ncbi:alpha/beta hydrolase [Methylibium petroleiphilum]|uniref:Putative esterase protein n=1 Tax=Methylibium petroleiphilum (strain ATCC BAA-1232 / LMG 22953 / PM1) TaxID=420662 RepID=A2SE43_METPP|nr:alpha/beta hydrolase [Methylibium petroleiphilum]ABM93832.1 putative esterase protein [Methylibium petroleiphilum PM1]